MHNQTTYVTVAVICLLSLLANALPSIAGEDVPNPIRPKETMPKFLKIMGGVTKGAGSDLYARGCQKLINESFPWVGTRHEPGSANTGLKALHNNDTDICVASQSAAFNAWKGKIKGVPPSSRIRALCVFPRTGGYQIITLRKRDDINSLNDIGDKRIGVGKKTSTTNRVTEYILRTHYGITYKGIKEKGGVVYYGSFSEMTEMLASGQLDICFLYTDVPSSYITQLDFQRGVKFIHLPENVVLGACKWRHTVPGVVPASTYKGLKKDMRILSGGQGFNVQETMPEEVAYNVLTALFKSREWTNKRWHEIAPVTKPYDWLESPTEGFTIPVHPGAVRYWGKRGIKIIYAPETAF